MTDKVLCPWCEKEMRPYPHQGYYWYQCECGARSPTLWHATQEQTKAKAISYTQELNRLKTENECYSHNIKNLTAENMQLQAEIERLQNESIGNCELAISMRNDNNLKGDCSYCIDKAKAEAIKEFAEMVKIKSYELEHCDDEIFKVVDVSDIDNLLKELVGEDK